MSAAVAHRGPDGHGEWVDPQRCVGLAHRRLAIVDLSAAANQPMTDIGGRATIVFNGEIYNHQELREDLEKTGARFQTDHSDTEVLLVGYLTWGIDALLERINGMFAFALCDHVRQRVLLIRDRIGIKPLYVARVGRGLVFGSEIKSLLAHSSVNAKLDRTSLYHYLSFRSTPAPFTLFEGIESVPPATLIELDYATGNRRDRQWWDPLDSAAPPPATLGDAEDRFDELLRSSVDLRMLADVPVSVFLSGGLDSATLLELASSGGRRLSTFTVTHPDHAAYDEGPDARARAVSVGALHHELPLTATQFADCLPRVTYHQDEPIAAPVCTSVYLLSKAVRDSGNKVVLAGEGADELLVGYDSWRRIRDLERLRSRLGPFQRLAPAGFAASLLATRSPWRSHPLGLADRWAARQPLFWSGAMDFAESAKRPLLGAEMHGFEADTFAECIEPRWRRFQAARGASDASGWMTYADLGFRLPQLMLPRLDKMGMATGIEGRVPFLDHRIVEFVMGLPPHWRGGTGSVGKALLRRVAARHLPREFVRQRKRGFRAPVGEWKHGDFGAAYGGRLVNFAERTGLLNPHAVRDLLAKRGGRLYFSLINLMLWHERFIEGVAAPTTAAPTRGDVAA